MGREAGAGNKPTVYGKKIATFCGTNLDKVKNILQGLG